MQTVIVVVVVVSAIAYAAWYFYRKLTRVTSHCDDCVFSNGNCEKHKNCCCK